VNYIDSFGIGELVSASDVAWPDNRFREASCSNDSLDMPIRISGTLPKLLANIHLDSFLKKKYWEQVLKRDPTQQTRGPEPFEQLHNPKKSCGTQIAIFV